ncbi:MAG: alpha/beta hydrolase [Eubacteriales bacterium]|nr:alpha/beta hydrolase [Lachnospiraceae bacterium]MDO5126613.1 alpha/beta hydrolase [Eubacteriales bacterium]
MENLKKTEEGISKRAMVVKKLVKEFNQNVTLKSYLIEKNRSESDIDKEFRYPEHLATRLIERDNYKMELLWRTGEHPDWVVLQLHGGGYVSAMKNNYRTMAGLYSEVCAGAAVLTIDYRVAPEHPYPAALFDALDAYEWLQEQGYDSGHIILAGDSAGGGLAIALCMYLREHTMQRPAGIVAMSPWADLTASGPSYDANYEVDVVFGNRRDSLIYDNPYCGGSDPTNPYISPVYGTFEEFPPMLIQVGTEEMLLSDAQTIAEKAKKAGVSVRFTEYSGMFHVFQMTAKVMPESMRAWSEVGKFFSILKEGEKL